MRAVRQCCEQTVPANHLLHFSCPQHSGPEAWAAQRRAWANPRKRRGAEQDGDAEERSRQPAIPPDAEYDTLLGAPYRRFEQPIPLPEMIEFLTECWALSIGLD